MKGSLLRHGIERLAEALERHMYCDIALRAVLEFELAFELKHDPEKWKPVFGNDPAQTKS